ncbi:hypothetical protein ACSLBF_01865 [Pseudoalteromonas sp. T1lg65]|uniref:hypothetical protein n=1 Tax=Pseudoalteromonas sp. T1lg65 TaxID=2077101 RepID=UPI003F7A8538
MNTGKKTFILSATLVLSACVGYSNAKPVDLQSESSYQLIAYQNCNPVVKHVMDQEQIAAYKDLKAAEVEMAAVELPMEDIEQQLLVLSKEIELVSADAIIEDGEKLVINKKLLTKQQEKAKQIEAVIEAHASKFEAIDDYADKVSAAADRFDESLVSVLGDLKGININVIEPGETPKVRCLASH